MDSKAEYAKDSYRVHVTLEEKLGETKAVWIIIAQDEVKRLENILSVTRTSNKNVTSTMWGNLSNESKTNEY